MITSPHNEKLKLIRRLGRRRTASARACSSPRARTCSPPRATAGAEPVELLTAAGEGLGGTEVEPALLAEVSKLGSGTRVIGVWRRRWAERAGGALRLPARRSDPGNVGTVVRTANALVGGLRRARPGLRRPYGPKAVRASMGAVFAEPLRARANRGDPGAAGRARAHGGEPLDELDGAGPSASAPSGRGCRRRWSAVRRRVTIPLRRGAESLNVAAAAAIALQRIASGEPSRGC